MEMIHSCELSGVGWKKGDLGGYERQTADYSSLRLATGVLGSKGSSGSMKHRRRLCRAVERTDNRQAGCMASALAEKRWSLR